MNVIIITAIINKPNLITKIYKLLNLQHVIYYIATGTYRWLDVTICPLISNLNKNFRVA